jgi:hypothetical protein
MASAISLALERDACHRGQTTTRAMRAAKGRKMATTGSGMAPAILARRTLAQPLTLNGRTFILRGDPERRSDDW